MRGLYLMMDEKRAYALFKIGYSSNIEQRMYSYTTASPEMRCLDRLKTYSKTHTDLDKAFKAELKELGYERTVSAIDGKRTEWFKVPYDSDMYMALIKQGFGAFKTTKNRKCYGELAEA